MLTEIRIDGLGVISTATAQFHEGLTVLTGETGAGKTMVVTSLHLLSGARADAGRVRLGASRAVVEGRFTIDDVNEAARAEVAEVLEGPGPPPARARRRICTRPGRRRAPARGG
ncbi:AAA family ATPase, partial [Nocardia cyriacigeorgica]|uniref:AAA family ATPase n=1 Tax=Nocardia cyriacigeorgica TaxID=135487 RepID=UPI00245621A9